jgi:ParB family chromosome partitioning protein
LASKRPAFRENIHRLFDEAQETDLAPGIVSLIESRATTAQLRELSLDRILPNPAQPRLSYEEDSLTELADSIREHGVLQPILVRPVGPKFELIAGERRWRASRLAERTTIPAIVVEFDEETALEASIIENLQREDVSPLEEAAMFAKMTGLGYSVRQLAQKIGKDKGYVENRMRLADAPAEIRELVSLRKDTISHAYELMKLPDERTRKRLAKKVAAGELTLAKLRALTGGEPIDAPDATPKRRAKTVAGKVAAARAADDALMDTRGRLADAVEELVDLLRQPEVMEEIPDVNRDNLAKYLTITKLKLENAIAIIRATREQAV